MERIIENKFFKIIPKEVISFDNIKYNNKLLENDIFEKYECKTELLCDLIICNDKNKINENYNEIIKESYDEYLKFIKNRNPDLDKWIYNIIDGKNEQDKILFKNKNFILIPNYKWNNDLNQLHLLAIPFDKNIRTIRELDKNHVDLLNEIKKESLNFIFNKFNVKEEKIKIFIHYSPSTYHLHIHFVNINKELDSSIEYTHDLNSIIFNLNLDSDYYRKIILNRRN